MLKRFGSSRNSKAIWTKAAIVLGHLTFVGFNFG